MNNDSNFSLQSRRQFLTRLGLGAAATWTLPIFLDQTFGALENAAPTLTQALTGKDSPILVVLQLAGGNDGLNTLIPYSDDNYHRVRPHIGVAPEKILRLDDHLGLHPNLTGLKTLHDEGLLTTIQGVGYPNPNRSHFRSTEIWQTASDANISEKHGWLGRYFDNACQGCDPTVGVSLSNEMPQAFTAATPTGICLPTNNRRLNDKGEEEEMEAGGSSIDMLGGGSRSKLSPLDYLKRTSLDGKMSNKKISAILQKIPAPLGFPNNELGQQFSTISRLIAGELPTRVYYLSLGGFDTHNNQQPTHERLMGTLSSSITAFVREMQRQGNYQRVMLLTFSEFGRRVAENASGGTDHGTAAPMFLTGGAIAPGVHGKAPSLTDLDHGDLKYTTDFRSIYATVLDKWLKTDSRKVLQGKFAMQDFVKA
ncbi:MAG: DUF1501 domain-containing protein [Chthoniobacterales bacterium]